MCVAVSLLIMLGMPAGRPHAEDARKFTLINVALDGAKLWLPSTVVVPIGARVELTLINTLDEPHGFKIAAFDVEEVVQPKGTTIVQFPAIRAGAFSYICHLHPPHIGGQILVLEK
jgi:heme/copper-type cytochrome/quinol oxidase subunit 2